MTTFLAIVLISDLILLILTGIAVLFRIPRLQWLIREWQTRALDLEVKHDLIKGHLRTQAEILPIDWIFQFKKGEREPRIQEYGRLAFLAGQTQMLMILAEYYPDQKRHGRIFEQAFDQTMRFVGIMNWSPDYGYTIRPIQGQDGDEIQGALKSIGSLSDDPLFRAEDAILLESEKEGKSGKTQTDN